MSRIALLTPYASPVPGGISSFVRGLARILAADGHDVSILAGEGGLESPGSNLGLGRTYVRSALEELLRVQPDVIHSHGHFQCLEAGWRYKRTNRQARLIFSFHTTAIPPLRQRLASLLKRADVVTFVSAAQLAYLRAALRLGGDLRILRPATDFPEFRPDAPREWAARHGVGNAFPILVFAGPLEYAQKVEGVIDLVCSLPAIRTQYPAAKLFVIGDGSLRPRVEAAARPMGDAVTITGFVDDPRPIMARADLYCHVSYQEGLPIALLEAMSVGTCIIASRTGGIPEVIDSDNGVLVNPGPEEVAMAVCKLAADPETRSRLGAAGRETIEKYYSWGARLPQVLSVYGEE